MIGSRSNDRASFNIFSRISESKSWLLSCFLSSPIDGAVLPLSTRETVQREFLVRTASGGAGRLEEDGYLRKCLADNSISLR